jgi:hypothetical protein
VQNPWTCPALGNTREALGQVPDPPKTIPRMPKTLGRSSLEARIGASSDRLQDARPLGAISLIYQGHKLVQARQAFFGRLSGFFFSGCSSLSVGAEKRRPRENDLVEALPSPGRSCGCAPATMCVSEVRFPRAALLPPAQPQPIGPATTSHGRRPSDGSAHDNDPTAPPILPIDARWAAKGVLEFVRHGRSRIQWRGQGLLSDPNLAAGYSEPKTPDLVMARDAPGLPTPAKAAKLCFSFNLLGLLSEAVGTLASLGLQRQITVTYRRACSEAKQTALCAK